VNELSPERRFTLVSPDGREMRQLLPVDAPDYWGAIQQGGREHLNQFGEDIATNNERAEITRQRIQESLDRGDLRFGIWVRPAAADKQLLVGHVGLTFDDAGNVSIGYWVGEPHTRQGHASCGITTVLGFVFGVLRVDRVNALVHVDNEASRRTAEATGFVWGRMIGKKITYTAFRGLYD